MAAASGGDDDAVASAGEGDAVTVEFLLPSGQIITSQVKLEDTFEDIKASIVQQAGLSMDEPWFLKLGGKMLSDDMATMALSSMRSVQEHQELGRVTKLTVVSHRQKKANQNKVISMEIGQLLGRPTSLYTLRGKDEVNVFRARIVPVIKEEMRSRKTGVYQFAPHTSEQPLPTSILDKIASPVLVRFHLSSTGAQMKTMKWNLLQTPAEVLEDIFTNSRKVIAAAVPADAKAEDYMLKAHGIADYFVGDNPLCLFISIRKSLLKHADIHVCMVSREEALADQAEEDEEEDAFEDMAEYGVDVYDHADLHISTVIRTGEKIQRLSMWDFTKKFRVVLAGIDRLSCAVPKTESVSVANKLRTMTMLRATSGVHSSQRCVYVVAGLYHGSQPLVPRVHSSSVLLSKQPRWNDNVVFDISISDIPRMARLCFTVYMSTSDVQDVSTDTPLGWVNCLVVDYTDHLQQGPAQLPMWQYAKANPIGTLLCNPDVNSCPILSIKFDEYVCPVSFPTAVVEYKGRMSLPEATPDDIAAVSQLVKKDPLYHLTRKEQSLLWEYRYYLKEIERQGLAKLLRALKWASRKAVLEMHSILRSWHLYKRPLDALELLDADFPDSCVREFAVANLFHLDDLEVMDYMIQLVQALKYEPRLDNPLAQYLIRRSLRSRHVGHIFFWCLKSEMHLPTVSERFGVYLEAYLRGCGRHRHELQKQHDFTSRLVDTAVFLKNLADPTKEVLHEKLKKIELADNLQLVHNQSLVTSGMKIDKCKFMQSKKVPLWVVMENADPSGKDIYVIFKEGDDLRQDMLTLQMIRIMDKLWQQEDMDLRMNPYAAVATGDEIGYIEVVLNASTLANIQMDYGGARSAFKDEVLDEWLKQQNGGQHAEAVENFVLSCAGYCVATYVLGIGDRHNDNIMMTKDGQLFHIDFGHFLGNIKTKFGVKRERTPFVFTPDMVYIMGGRKGENFKRFCDLACNAFLVLRRHANMFINLFAMMLSTGIPELQCADDIGYLRQVLVLDATEEEANDYFLQLIEECLDGGWTTQFNWWVHNVVHSSNVLKKKI